MAAIKIGNQSVLVFIKKRQIWFRLDKKKGKCQSAWQNTIFCFLRSFEKEVALFFTKKREIIEKEKTSDLFVVCEKLSR